MDGLLFVYLFIWTFGSFPCFTRMNKAAVNIFVQIFVGTYHFRSLEYITTRGMAEFCGYPMLVYT